MFSSPQLGLRRSLEVGHGEPGIVFKKWVSEVFSFWEWVWEIF